MKEVLLASLILVVSLINLCISKFTDYLGIATIISMFLIVCSGIYILCFF